MFHSLGSKTKIVKFTGIHMVWENGFNQTMKVQQHFNPYKVLNLYKTISVFW